ncbi:Uncharacterised protein [Vibrio cholerae]|nr:Uncharacterised protein [Vibrio cholerae]
MAQRGFDQHHLRKFTRRHHTSVRQCQHKTTIKG